MIWIRHDSTKKRKIILKTVLDIFKYDVRTVVRNVFALILVLGIGFFPALYAWINLYATNDPYANTGNIEIAVASDDMGIDRGGEHINASVDVCDMLKDNHDIGWRIVDTSDDAIKGVKAGDYYAAIIFEDNFTSNMYDIESALSEDNYSITYYSNNKKNAVAPKITDAASEALLEKINARYLEIVFGEVFTKAEDAGEKLDLDSEEAVDDFMKDLAEAKAALSDYDKAITQFSANSEDLSSALKDAESSLAGKRSSIESDAASVKEKIKEAKKTISAVSDDIDESTSDLKKAINELKSAIDAVKDPADAKSEEAREKIISKVDTVLTKLQALRAVLPEKPSTKGGQLVANVLDNMITHAEAIKTAASESTMDISGMSATVSTLKELHKENLLPGFKTMMKELKTALKLAEPLVASGNNVLDDIDPVLEEAADTVDGLDETLLHIQPTIQALEKRIDSIIDKVNAAEKDERIEVLTKLLGGDPGDYSNFFANLVEVETQEIYKAKSFGAAMVPFYTAIALWVGGVMMISTLRTNINRRKFPDATEAQGFFGRFITFFLIGQMQAAITLAGEIFLFGCEPVHPWLLYLATAFTALIFDMLIFSLVLAFGNIGKAIVIVLMVLQIAGSSGTFPLELLPPVFEKIYLFFPFPYAINAMREGLSGLYGHDYLIYLAQLAVFGVIAVIIGIFVRRPFEGVDQFVTEKMEETEVL